MAMSFGGQEIYLTPHEAAQRLRVSPVTLRHWSLEGRLAFVTTPGGHRRYAREEIERFAREHQTQADQQRVLLVEDNVLVSAYLTALFEGLDSPVASDVARDVFETGLKLADFRPHAVLLDLTTPGLDALSICRRIKENPGTRDTMVVVITDDRHGGEERRARAEGAEACLYKPLEMAQLMAALGLERTVPI
jgi:excisionase family DNA binding protein